MARFRVPLAELHAYAGLILAAVGVGLLLLPAGLIVGGCGLFYLAHRIPATSTPQLITTTTDIERAA